MPLWGKSTPAPVAPAAAAAGASSDDEGDDDDDASRQRGRLDGRTWLDEEALNVGVEVQIHSLTGATEHNGSRGELLRFDSEKGRWDVRIGIGQNGRVLALKPDNLYRVMARESRAAEGTTAMGAPGNDHRFEVGALVKVHSLTGAVEHNRAHGTLVRLDERTGRWEVQTVERGGGAKTLSLKPENLTLMASAADMAKLDAWRNERQVPKAKGHWGIPKGFG